MIETMPRKTHSPSALFLRLKQLREDHKLTQRDLARMSGISQPTIAAWESGRVDRLSIEAVQNLAPVYGMTPEGLMTYLRPGSHAGKRETLTDAENDALNANTLKTVERMRAQMRALDRELAALEERLTNPEEAP